MIETIQMGYSALSGALDIAKGFQSLKTEKAVNDAVIDIQTRVLDAQRALMDAESRHRADRMTIEELRKELAEREGWGRVREQYELVEVSLGAFAYMPKGGVESGMPAHWLCPRCFEHEEKSFFQFKGQDKTPGGGRGLESTYGCDNCKSNMKVSYSKKPSYEVD